MICQYISKNNVRCKHKTIGNLNFCYMKRHHKNKDLYEKYKNKEEEKFNNKSILKNNFQIVNVSRDGACLFSSIANFINENLENLKI